MPAPYVRCFEKKLKKHKSGVTLFIMLNPIFPCSGLLREILYILLAQGTVNLPAIKLFIKLLMIHSFSYINFCLSVLTFEIFAKLNLWQMTVPWAARLKNTSFESPNEGQYVASLLKCMGAFLSFIALAQITILNSTVCHELFSFSLWMFLNIL